MKPIWPLIDVDAQLPWRARCAAVRTLMSGNVTMGAKVYEFEERFADLMCSNFAVMVNSGSSANLIAVAAIKQARRWASGDEAIVPAIAWPTTYSPLAQHGLKLRVVDVDAQTLNADERTILDAITPRTKVIVGVSILGHSMYPGNLWQRCAEQGIWFMEDNCESLGSSDYLHGLAGTFGNIGTFSLFMSHQLSTIEGGMIVTQNRTLADTCRCLRSHGWARDLASDSVLLRGSYPSPFPAAYRFLIPGYNVRPTEIQATIGLHQLDTLHTDQTRRRDNAAYFAKIFDSAGLESRFERQKFNASDPVFGFVVIARDRPLREKTLGVLSTTGIEYRMVTGGCFTEHEAARHYGYETVGDLPNAKHIHHCGFFVGNHPRDLRKQIDKFITVLKEAA